VICAILFLIRGEKKMGKKVKFTEEEIAVLSQNPYTYRVTAYQISFTKEFKDLFWSEYQRRLSPSKIFRKYGYDINILGAARMSGFQRTLKAEAEAGLVFHQGPRAAGEKKRLISGDDSVPTETILEMQHKIDYLEQEIEFLKKIMSGKRTGKQG
jgi:hypothetical protein